MRYHRDLIQPGKVSIWTGSVTSEDELIEYVDDGAFAKDFDYVPYPETGREVVCFAIPKPIPELVSGFSGGKLFAKPCAIRAAALGIIQAHCMVVLYNSAFEPAEGHCKENRLQFIGVFEY